MRNKEYVLIALQYVKNTAGDATVEHFIDDFAPIGDSLWTQCAEEGFVDMKKNKIIFLTKSGIAFLESNGE